MKRSLSGQLHSVYDDLCLGNRDGKSNHPFPRRTGTDPDSAFTEKIQTRSISADCSRRYIRIFYDIL